MMTARPILVAYLVHGHPCLAVEHDPAPNWRAKYPAAATSCDIAESDLDAPGLLNRVADAMKAMPGAPLSAVVDHARMAREFQHAG